MKELAHNAGLSVDLIKKYERGDLPITVKSLSKLEKILGKIEDDSDVIRLDLKWSLSQLSSCLNYDLCERLSSECRRNNGIIPHFSLSLSERNVDARFNCFQRTDYQQILNGERLSLRELATEIVNDAHGRRIHLICLTCGHDWLELDLAQALAVSTDSAVRVSIVHPSYPLLKRGLDVFLATSNHLPNLSWHGYVGTYEAACRLLLCDNNYRQVVCMLGTFANYDFDRRLLEYIYPLLRNDDLLLFDTLNRVTPVDEKSIFRTDLRLNGQLPTSWAREQEIVIENCIRDQVRKPLGIVVNPTLVSQSRFPFALCDYAIDLQATIDDGVSPIWKISGMRLHRHSVRRIVKALASMGWKLRRQQTNGQEFGLRISTSLLLFSRRAR